MCACTSGLSAIISSSCSGLCEASYDVCLCCVVQRGVDDCRGSFGRANGGNRLPKRRVVPGVGPSPGRCARFAPTPHSVPKGVGGGSPSAGELPCFPRSGLRLCHDAVALRLHLRLRLRLLGLMVQRHVDLLQAALLRSVVLLRRQIQAELAQRAVRVRATLHLGFPSGARLTVHEETHLQAEHASARSRRPRTRLSGERGASVC